LVQVGKIIKVTVSHRGCNNSNKYEYSRISNSTNGTLAFKSVQKRCENSHFEHIAFIGTRASESILNIA
jgi:hypothetical protein